MVVITINDICQWSGSTPSHRNFREGERLVAAKHLLNCGIVKEDGDVFEISASCIQTSNVRGSPHEIHGILGKNGEVKSITCSCKAGLGEKCKHIMAALLFCSRNEISVLSCTDIKCQWKQKYKDTLQNYMARPLEEHECLKSTKNENPLSEDVEMAIKSILLQNLPNSAFSKHVSGRHNPVILKSVENNVGGTSIGDTVDEAVEVLFTLQRSEFMDAIKNVSITVKRSCCEETIRKMKDDFATICQRSKESYSQWQKQRRYRITGSRCYALYTYSRRTNADRNKKCDQYCDAPRFKFRKCTTRCLMDFVSSQYHTVKTSTNMEETVNTVKNIFKKKTLQVEDPPKSSVPQIGFRVSFCESSKELTVKVIGARQLPTDYGSVKPRGYLVKVTFYPQKQKFETKTVKDSWPTINEEFSCLILPLKKFDDFFKGQFVSFTVYAILGKEEDDEKQLEKPKGVLKRYFSFTDGEEIFSLRKSSFRRSGSQRRSSYNNCLNNRRTVGAVTYNLDRKFFSQKLRTGVISTPDIWRNIAEITSGIQTQPRDGTKGSIELTLQYGISEDGTNDVVEVTVTKFRCGLQTMQLHEKIGGQLYIKITAFEDEDLIQKMKSDKFEPTISLKLEANTSTLRATVNKYNLGQVKILIRLMSRNIVGKKTLLGKIEIDRNSNFWKEIVSSPSVPLTKMVNFE